MARGGTRRRRTITRRRWSPSPLAMLAFASVAILIGSIAFWLAHPPKPAPRPKFTMDEARAYNARIPFVSGPLTPAAPFHFHGTPAAREQAVLCLATAALYEAGDDPRGQAAVIQVVLNRVRVPGFPKTVCGVVYQGSGLTTGCQFSFTCDGSVARRPEHAGWEAARLEARRALSGHVFRAVGTATHYHADWMVPYWIGSLDKIAKVKSHIFYRPKAPAS